MIHIQVVQFLNTNSSPKVKEIFDLIYGHSFSLIWEFYIFLLTSVKKSKL